MANERHEHDPREELLVFLLGKIEEDRYPSVTMMDLVEELLRPEEIGDYTDVLMTKIRKDQFPSLALMHRVRALA